MNHPLTPEQRRYQNRTEHLQTRQNANLARGPKGIAAVWWDQARAVATRAEREGDASVWDRLALALTNWCDQEDQRPTVTQGDG
ncbi:hypothetical protein [Streptomyces sp. NBC_00989]|uniref:hypothetical protein n=1 Tax=Streptomyces sp. NBC_00989 TaxID=2903705 RepID=UPI00386C8E1A|nr:hypothetical protein OG714_38220 [Streptomyces sp. NBC_00989]